MITLEERIAEFRDVVRSCALCPLSQTRTLAVPGEGPVTAEVMCIGEAPGMNEDKQGKPFVGAAGNFLTELLAAAGLKREDVYICNVLKCRPPNNRDPLPEEIEACSEYLDLQLDMVDPLVVVTLGRFSMSKWFPQQAISRIHGTVKEADGRFIVPMYHPAAALHQGSLRQVLLDDFARLPAILAKARATRAAETTTPSEPRPPAIGGLSPTPPTPNRAHSPLPRSEAESGEGSGVRAQQTTTARQPAPENQSEPRTPVSGAMPPTPPTPNATTSPLLRSEAESGEGSGVKAEQASTAPQPAPETQSEPRTPVSGAMPPPPPTPNATTSPLPRSQAEPAEAARLTGDTRTQPEPTAEPAPAAKSSQLSLFD